MEEERAKRQVLERGYSELRDVFEKGAEQFLARQPSHDESQSAQHATSNGAAPPWVGNVINCFDAILRELRAPKATQALESRQSTDSGFGDYDAPGTEDCARPEIKESPKQTGTGFQDRKPRIQPEKKGQLKDFGPVFSVSYRDISGALDESKFEEFSAHPSVKQKGYFKLAVQDLPVLSVEETSWSQPTEDHCTNFVSKRDSKGFVEITKAPNQSISHLRFPLPETERRSWSQDELKELYESTLRSPPKGWSYVIGNYLFSDIELSPGKGLEKIGGYNLAGVGTTYAYMAFEKSISVMHGEDAKFRSINLLRSGEIKCWLFVQPAYEQELLDRMRLEFPRKWAGCSQSLRHLSRLIPPSKLDHWGIPYCIDYCKPGEAFVTEPGTFHQVLNLGANYAIAINILYSSSKIVPDDYKFCQYSCDPYAITPAHLLPLDQIPRAHDRSPPQSEDIGSITTIKRKASSSLIAEIPAKKTKSTPQISILVDAISGPDAFYNLCNLMRSWGEHGKSLLVPSEGSSPAFQVAHALDLMTGHSHLEQFLQRLLMVRLVDIISTEGGSHLSGDASAITALLYELKWNNDTRNETNRNRRKLHGCLKTGRQWKKICGNFDGLLCLIPTDQKNYSKVSGSAYYDLSRDDLKLFRSEMESNDLLKSMCQMGRIFQTSISDGIEVPKFKWEGKDLYAASQLPTDQLVQLMEVLPVEVSICASDSAMSHVDQGMLVPSSSPLSESRYEGELDEVF